MVTKELEKTPIWLDIKNIINSSKQSSLFELRALLHTKKENVPILKVLTLDTVRDYYSNIGDYVVIEFKMTLGNYINKLYPYRNNLEMSVKKILITSNGSNNPLQKENITEVKYKAVLMNDNISLGISELNNIDTNTLDVATIIDVKLQLLDRSLEILRVKTISGVYNNYTAKELIHGLLGSESLKIKIEGSDSISAIDIVEPDNPDKINNAIFPDGTHLIALTSYIQEELNGIYNSGLGTYLQVFNNKKTWFVYPLFNFKRYDSSISKCIFYSAPEERLSGLDTTYHKEGNVLKVIATAAKKYVDSNETDFMNYGVGFRTATASAFMKKPIMVTEEGPVANRTRLNFEVTGQDREDGVNYAPVSSKQNNKRGISNNPYVDFSTVNSRNLSRIDISWENCNADLIHPGMPCKYVYMDNGELNEVKGTIVFVHEMKSISGIGINTKTYKSICAVTILAEKVKKKLIEKPKDSYGIY